MLDVIKLGLVKELREVSETSSTPPLLLYVSLGNVHGQLCLPYIYLFSLFLGPKAFPLDRLMAIFYTIVEDKVAPSASILSQISSLVSLNLLSQISADDQIDSAKYKCLVGFDFIKGIAKQLEFDILQYLFDFV